MEITIIIPEGNYPDRLATCLYGLVNNSYYKHNIFVITSGIGTAATNSEGAGITHFSTIEQYIRENKKFIEDNKISFVDVSSSKENVSRYFLKYNIEKPESHRWEGGIDTAFKVNFGIDLAKTEWIMPNFDDDFFPSKNWDLNLFKVVRASEKAVYIPTHVQPYSFEYLKKNYGMDLTEKDIDVNWVWNKSREIACARLTVPINRDPFYLLESEWNAFVAKYSINKTIYEPCGLRQRLHYLPMLFKKSDILSIGGYTLMGSGYELNVDDRFAQHGYTKVSSQDSFILHKGFIKFDESEPW